MGLADLLILAAVVVCAVFAVRRVRKNGGGCTGNCADCHSRGAGCDKKK